MTELNKHSNAFLDQLYYQKNYSKHSISNYRRDLELFKTFTQNSDQPLNQINKRICRQFLYYTDQQKHYHPSSLSRLISTLRSFWKYLLQESIVTENPWANIKLPKRPKTLPKNIPTKQMITFLDGIAIDTPVGLRDRLLFECLYGSGIRVAELCNLTLTSVSLTKQEIRVLGKGNKERIAILSPIACQIAVNYLSSARPLWDIGHTQAFFLNQQGGPLSIRSVQRILKQHCEQSNLAISLSPHDLRHSFATDLYNGGADLSVIKELLGHKNISSTEIYTHVTNEALEQTLHSAHPSSQ